MLVGLVERKMCEVPSTMLDTGKALSVVASQVYAFSFFYWVKLKSEVYSSVNFNINVYNRYSVKIEKLPVPRQASLQHSYLIFALKKTQDPTVRFCVCVCVDSASNT